MYDKLAPYYKYIFPASQAQVEFFRLLFLEHRVESVLDVACGTGEQLEAFAGMGLKAHGLELEEAMVGVIRSKPLCQEGKLTIKLGNMLNAAEGLPGPYDAVICIGNSLVHLASKEEISRALQSMAKTLKHGGLVVIQIVNYDRILDWKVTSLPVIETQDERGSRIVFHREYALDDRPDKIVFKTTLSVGEEQFTTSTFLHPLRSGELLSLAREAGFTTPRFFGGYDFSPFSGQSQGCILVAVKKAEETFL